MKGFIIPLDYFEQTTRLSSKQIIWKVSTSCLYTLLCPCNSQLVSSKLSVLGLHWFSLHLKHALAFLDQRKYFSDVVCVQSSHMSKNSRAERNQHHLPNRNQISAPTFNNSTAVRYFFLQQLKQLKIHSQDYAYTHNSFQNMFYQSVSLPLL